MPGVGRAGLQLVRQHIGLVCLPDDRPNDRLEHVNLGQARRRPIVTAVEVHRWQGMLDTTLKTVETAVHEFK